VAQRVFRGSFVSEQSERNDETMKLSTLKTKAIALVLTFALCLGGLAAISNQAEAATDYVTLLEESRKATAYTPVDYTFTIPSSEDAYLDVLVPKPTDLACVIASVKTGDIIFMDSVLSTNTNVWQYKRSLGLYSYSLTWGKPTVGDYLIVLNFGEDTTHNLLIKQEVSSLKPTPTPTSIPTPTPTLIPTPTPTSIPTPTPTLIPTPTPTLIPTPTLSPTPTPTLPPTPTPTPELQVSVNKMELKADAQGNLSDNRVDVSLISTYDCSVSTGSSSWLKVCKKNASASASTNIWLSNSEKEGTCSFYVFADENTSIVPRKGEITITASDWDKTVTAVVEVTQEAGKAVLDVSATEITANSKGKTNVSSIKVTTNKTGGFSVNNDGNSWIKLGSSSYESNPKAKVSFEAEGTFYVFVSENPSDEERTGSIIVTHEDGETKEIIKVRQEGAKAALTVDSTSKLVDNNGAFYNNAVYVETSDTGSFTATVEDATWLKVSSDRFTSFADGMSSITLGSNAYIYLFADKNMGEERTATIKITHEGGKLTKTVTVTQLGKPASYLQVDRETAYFDEPTGAIDGMIHISADENTKWTVTSSAGWIKILKNAWDYEEQYASIEGTGSGGFYIYVKENNTYKERSGYITISAPGLESYQIYVHQVENEISLDALLQELSISVTKKTFKKGKTTKIKLNYPEGLYASDIKSVKFSSSKKKVATVNSKGVVKGIKKGKAVISVKVTLENGSSRTFKARITVDRRKVKLAKFK